MGYKVLGVHMTLVVSALGTKSVYLLSQKAKVQIFFKLGGSFWRAFFHQKCDVSPVEYVTLGPFHQKGEVSRFKYDEHVTQVQ